VADPKTKPTTDSVKAFLDSIPDAKRKADCQAVARLMRTVTKADPVLWGPSIVGFGKHTFTYPSGRTVEWFLIGFSPRKKDLSVYVTPSLSGYGDLLARLGPHKCGKACLYVTALADVDAKVLKELLTRAVKQANGG
jgi:hypothetical protein